MDFFNAITENEIERLIKQGSSPDIQNLKGDTLLHKLVAYRKIDAINKLLELGGNTNIRNNNGQTPFHYVKNIENDINLNIIKILLKYGGNPYLPDKNKKIPFLENNLICKYIKETDFIK
jgi:ankyrin repeat protein